MRTLWYLFLFITPTVILIGYFNREPLREFLEEQGYLTSEATEEESESGEAPEEKSSEASVEESVAEEKTPEAEVPEPLVAENEEKFPMPEFKTLEEVVDNWRAVPKNAFPEKVVIHKPVAVELVSGNGHTQRQAGQQMYPISLEGDQLTVATTSAGAVTGKIGIDDTDFKARVRVAYDQWKERQIAEITARREAEKRAESAKQQTGNVPPANGSSELGPEPKVLPGGRIQEMVDSIQSGEVQEIKLDKIDYWRWNGYEEIEGVGYWTGVVGYVANTIFGELNTEGKALIRNGKVVKWIYSGSQEPIK